MSFSNKKRILFIGEAAYAPSGFGKYTRQLLTRLQASGKYEIAELSCFAHMHHPKDDMITWRYYANNPSPNNKNAVNEYRSNKNAKFGSGKFERVCLDFKPDIVTTFQDPFMSPNYLWLSHFRDYFHLCLCPTVDSMPQRTEWIWYLGEADSLLTYSEYGFEELKKALPHSNVAKAIYPANTPEIKPLDPGARRSLRQSLNLDPDSFIIGTVVRNQKRKLLFDLIEAFGIYLKEASEELAKKTYLLLHTSYPDLNPWEIPSELLRSGVAKQVLFTYYCKACEKYEIRPWKTPNTFCSFCQKSSRLPNVGDGVTEEQLGEIYNLMDLYVQYAICEGSGFPPFEAAAAGVPVMASEYSATRDTINKINGFGIPTERMFWDLEMGAKRSLPDIEHTVDAWIQYFGESAEYRANKGQETLDLFHKEFSWDKNAEEWMDHFDSIELKNRQGKWFSAKHMPRTTTELPKDIKKNPQAYMYFVAEHVMGRPDLKYSWLVQNCIKDLITGHTPGGDKMNPVDTDAFFNFAKNWAKQHNIWEQARIGNATLPLDDYIDYANIKDMLND